MTATDRGVLFLLGLVAEERKALVKSYRQLSVAGVAFNDTAATSYMDAAAKYDEVVDLMLAIKEGQ